MNRLRVRGLVIVLCSGAALAQDATITGVSTGGVGYATYSAGTDGINADVGRWDSPYTGHDPSLEPEGFSYFFVDIDVKAGGTLLFDYSFETWDAGIWDWLDISLETPSGNVVLVDHLGKPGSTYGTYWSSSSIALAQPLDEWADQHVRLVVGVMQDGWGDQTVGRIRNLKLASCSAEPSAFAIATDADAPACKKCSVAPLAEITDADAISFENGNQLNTDGLTDEMNTAVDCFRDKVEQASGTFSLSSAYRPAAYQAHLKEVWNKWTALKDNAEEACKTIKQKVQAEFSKHGLLPSQEPAGTSKHTQGLAIDAKVTLPTDIDRDDLADECGLVRNLPKKDPVHYILK